MAVNSFRVSKPGMNSLPYEMHAGVTLEQMEEISMKHKFLFIALILFIVSSGPLLAQGMPADAAPPVAVLRAALDLSKEQVGDIRGLIEERAKAIRPIEEQVRLLQRELDAAMNNDAPDPLEVGDLVLEIRMLRREIWQHREDFRQAFQLLLTPMHFGSANRE